MDPGHGQRLGQRQDAGLPGRRRRARRRGRDAGLEAITWVPDELLVAKGFIDESKGARYNPADYAGHGTGLFFAGVEQDGRIIAYALNRSTGTFSRVATIASGFPKVMELTYEPESRTGELREHFGLVRVPGSCAPIASRMKPYSLQICRLAKAPDGD